VYFESLKEELNKTGIKVQVISPGFINTEVTLNSLDAQGNPLQRNSKAQENGMPADLFAQKLIGALESDRFHRYIGRKELLAVPLHALSPRLFYKLLG
jgi:short-subunit dehydrogenase